MSEKHSKITRKENHLKTETFLKNKNVGDMRVRDMQEGLRAAFTDIKELKETSGVKSVSATVDDQVGTPDVSVDFSEGELSFAFSNLKGEQGIQGIQGPQGDSVIVGEGDLPLAHTLGQDNTKAMSQKGVTDVVTDGMIEETVIEQERVDAYHVDDDYTWEVSSETGAYASTNNPHRSIEVDLTPDILSITYATTVYSGNFGYAFLDADNNFVSGEKTIEAGEEEIDVVTAMAQGAIKFRCCRNTTNNYIDISIKKKIFYWPIRYEETGQNTDGWMTQEAVTNAIQDATAITENETESESVAVYQSGGSKKFNVKADTGAFASSSTAAIRAMELDLEGDELEITYQATAYTGNFGYAFLNAQDGLVQGVKTTSDTVITVDAATPIQNGAVKFRCSSAINKDAFNIKIKRSVTTSLKDVVEDITYKASPDSSTIRLTFPTKIINPNNVTESGEAPEVTEKTGCALLRLAANYSKAGLPTKLALFFPGAGDYTTPGSTNFPADMQTCIDYMVNSGYSVLMPFAWDTDSACGSFATPYSVSNYTKAVRKVCEEYNVEQNGVYVWGRSLGATNVIGFGYLSGIHIKGAALHSGLVGSFASNNASSGQKPYLIKHVFDNDGNYERTTAYLTANLHKIAPYDNILNGLIDITDEEKVAYLVSNNDPEGGFGAKHRLCPFPLKIWHAPDDTNVPYSRAYAMFQSILKTGGRCEFRMMPENYTDEYVETANPHHICDTNGPTADVTTSLGIEMERVPIAYIEMVEFWER